jgi:hypothetical protein
MRLLVTVYGPDGLPAESRICEPGEPLSFHVPSPYLISAGQPIDIGVSVFDADAVVANSTFLDDAMHFNLIDVPVVWDVSFIPSNRLLADILGDVVQHALDHTGHGVNCACMDKFAREIRLQASKSLPPDGRTTDSDWAGPIQDRLESKARVRHVLKMVVDNL